MTTEPKFTPGPWKIDRRISETAIWGPDNYPIAEVTNRRGGIDRANALVMHAAPELYEALKRALPLALAGMRVLPQRHADDDTLRMIRTALAKASGVKP